MKAGTVSDDLDRDLLAEVLVIFRDIGRIVEREVHHCGFIGIYLQNKAVLFLNRGLPLRYLRRRLLISLRCRRRHDDEQGGSACCRCFHHV